MTAPNLPDASRLLAQQGPARLVREVLEAGETEIACAGTVPPESPYAEGERVSSVAALELAAQAAAAHETIVRMGKEAAVEPKVGYLVNIGDVVFAAADFPAGATLVVRAKLESQALPLSVYRLEVTLDDRTILTGSVSTYLDPA
jgi:predicted hotdog family 3-hydroxylacyl-ACP dehydratase